MKKMLLAAAAATAMISSAAIAAVTYDENGYGFVGKGDVQLAFGWNNAAMQKNHLGVDFYVQSSARYEVVCEWTTVTGGKNSKTILHDVTKKYTISDSAAIDSTSRKTGQYTGWHLNGYLDARPDSADLPTIGSGCPQGGTASDSDAPGNDAVVADAYYVGEPATGLYATFNNDPRELAITPTF
jgi:opacity protein-like surface antigen